MSPKGSDEGKREEGREGQGGRRVSIASTVHMAETRQVCLPAAEAPAVHHTGHGMAIPLALAGKRPGTRTTRAGIH